MKPKRFAVFTLMIALTASLPLVAHAQLADPGFSYVDVNNDGLYTPGNGDIPITPSILSAIQSSGSFDTQQSIPGIYQAPECPASLIIPASQQLAFPTPLFLQAGENVVIHGSITAPALALCTDDDGQADLTGATVNVNSSLQVYAEEGVILDGSAISCSDPDSEVHVCTDDQVSAIGASIFTGMELSIRAEDGVDMDNASIYAQSADSMVKVCSDGGIQANSFITAGTVRFRADDGGITFNKGAITANSVRLCSDGQTDVSGSFFTVNGPMKLAGDDGVLGITSAISATQLCVEGDCGVDFSQSSLYASAGPIWMQSDDGPISLNAAYVSSAGGLAACSDGGVDVTSASINSDCYTALYADCGSILADGSSISPYSQTPPTDTYIDVEADGPISANNAKWTAPACIQLSSCEDNITARTASFTTTGQPGDILFYAGGGSLDLTGTVVTATGTISYEPDDVTVIH